MPEITDEQMETLEKAEKEAGRRKESNRKRSVAIGQLIKAHNDEYKRYFDAA